ncbi:MAG: dTDP-4-amino-4,6-dideoxygalactose transaminase [Bacteroidales bacterium]|nr:dTDP-4-amino-4,6-dideoxygalactose transaminase [Bacteroidales bacterium]
MDSDIYAIPFNKPYLTGKEAHYIYQAVYSGKISGNGLYTKKCQAYFQERYGFKKTLLTTSCTDALEMSAILLNIKAGDEVIVPSYTFVSSALAFIRQGATIVFADSKADQPNIDEQKLESLITDKTKAIVVVHYAGVACDMDKIMSIANKHKVFVVEDAAQAIESHYNNKILGSIGHISTFSFHETKNISSGEGGLLVVNDDRFIDRSEIIWEKGTNRAQFFRGEVNKYGWVDVGSSFLPSDVIAAFLYAQLENLDDIQGRRIEIWERYYEKLRPLEAEGFIKLPLIPQYATNNAHMFYILCRNVKERTKLINYLKSKSILAVFHYLSLHKSDYYKKQKKTDDLTMSNLYQDTLLRLPFYYELYPDIQNTVIEEITKFYHNL